MGRNGFGRLARLHPALTLLLAATFTMAAPARAQVLPAPDAFTVQVANLLNRQAPPQPVQVAATLTLRTKAATGADVQVSLDRIYAACRLDQERCPEIVRAFANSTVTLLRQDRAELTEASLRAVVRPDMYVRNLPPLPGGPIPTFTGSLPSGLVALIYQDTPTAMRLVNPAEFQALHLSPE